MAEAARSPLGAVPGPDGVEFSLFSSSASRAAVALFNAPDAVDPVRVVSMRRRGDEFRARVTGAGPGTLYAFRVDGPRKGARGRFRPELDLLDPYARAVTGPPGWRDRVFDARPPLARPKAVVVAPPRATATGPPPRTPWSDTVLYEVHVKGMTARHPDVPARLRGTYLGLASEPVIAHLRSLGVTAVELLPVHASVTEPPVAARGLSNYWGYSTIAWFAPDARFATADLGREIAEFREMVAALHHAGIEVILDVVYNHTGEGPPDAPPLSLRGIDPLAYYRHDDSDPERAVDWTGCGNTVNTEHPAAARLVLESLRYWVAEMGVDGFRFDLAASLARDPARPGRLAPLIELLDEDPVLSPVKKIVEPWDLGPQPDYRGRFPASWREWNDRFRDAARRFWRGDSPAGELATRLAGSSDLYGPSGRSPLAGVSYVTAHDGMTLADLVSYERKHNEANRESGRDGPADDLSQNHGVEGPTDDPGIRDLRDRTRRSLLATLFLSKGVPMLLGGDEIGRTQRGNNNAFAHDSEVSWHDWSEGAVDRDLLAFVRRLAKERAGCAVFRDERFLTGEPRPGTAERDVVWLAPEGREMEHEDWTDRERTCVGMLLYDPGGTLLLVVNGGPSPVPFRLPSERAFRVRVHTAEPSSAGRPRGTLRIPGRTLVLLREEAP